MNRIKNLTYRGRHRSTTAPLRPPVLVFGDTERRFIASYALVCLVVAVLGTVFR